MKSIIAGLILFTNLLAMSADLNKMNDQNVDKTPYAVILKIEGRVKVLPADSIKKHNALKDELLFKGDKLITYTDAKALIELADGSKVILDEKAELTFVGQARLDHVSGEIYYKIKKRSGSQGLSVKTPFSIIGIKGTEFIVNTVEGGEIALNEGLIGVASLHAEFELHKKKMMADYEAFKNNQMQEFEAYKAQFHDETVTYVKAFDLQSNRLLRFGDESGCEAACESKVNEQDFTDETKKRFAYYQEMIEE